MSTSPTPDPEVVVIKEKKEDGNAWMWAIFGIVLVAIVLIIAGVCMCNKDCKKAMYMTPNMSMPPSYAPSSLAGGASRSAMMSVAPVTHSMLASSTAPMSFVSY